MSLKNLYTDKADITDETDFNDPQKSVSSVRSVFYKIHRITPFSSNWLAWLVLISTFLLLFNAPIRELIRDWDVDPNYGHGFLIPFISFYLVWRKRDALQSIEPKPARATGFAMMLGACLLFIFGTAAAEWFISRVSMILFIVGLVYYFAGRRVFRSLWFPIAYLLFMVPIPYVIYYKLTFPMQLISSDLAFNMINLLGIGGIQEGNILHFQGYSMEVIEACSGLRSMMVLLSLGALISQLSFIKTYLQIILFLAAIPIALLANVLRLVLTAMLGVLWGPQYAQGFLHEGSGILVFLFGLTCLVCLRGIVLWFVFRDRISS